MINHLEKIILNSKVIFSSKAIKVTVLCFSCNKVHLTTSLISRVETLCFRLIWPLCNPMEIAIVD